MSRDISPQGNGSRFTAWLRNAFATGPAAAAMVKDDEALLDRVVAWVAARRLAAPVSVMLESMKPLGYVGSQAMVMAEPIVSMTLQVFPGLSKHLSEQEFRRLARLLEKRDTIDLLLARIEKAEREQNDD